MPMVIPAGTDLRALMTDPRFPWDHASARVQLHVSRGWGPGRIYWGNWFSREILEDVAFPIEDYIVEEMVRVCLQLQADEPERPTEPVTADGSYQVEWEWRPLGQPLTDWALTGQLVNVNVIDRLISDVRRQRDKARFERGQVIPRLIDSVEKQKTAQIEITGGGGGGIIPAEWQREMLDKWLKPHSVEGEAVPLVDYLHEQIAKDIAATEQDLLLYGASYRDKNGKRLDPRTVKIKP